MTRDEQERRRRCKCRHYATPGGSEVCAAGIDRTKFNEGRREGYLLKVPCFGPDGFDGRSMPGGVCESYSPLTEDEIRAEEERIDSHIAALRTVQKAIREKCASEGVWQGSVPCALCQVGTVRFSMARVNGHVHGKCSTPGCLAWMQ